MMIKDHPDCPLTDLRRIWWCSIRHGSSFSRVGASGKPGAVHTPCVGSLFRCYSDPDIRKHNLQNPKNKREILADAKFKAVFRQDKATRFEMNKLLSAHLS